MHYKIPSQLSQEYTFGYFWLDKLTIESEKAGSNVISKHEQIIRNLWSTSRPSLCMKIVTNIFQNATHFESLGFTEQRSKVLWPNKWDEFFRLLLTTRLAAMNFTDGWSWCDLTRSVTSLSSKIETLHNGHSSFSHVQVSDQRFNISAEKREISMNRKCTLIFSFTILSKVSERIYTKHYFFQTFI